jgi:hypothetical protein
MRNDFEQLLWFHAMGIEDIAVPEPINYFNVQIKRKLNDTSDQAGSLKDEKNTLLSSKDGKLSIRTFEKRLNEITELKSLEEYWKGFLVDNFDIKKFWGVNKVNELEPPSILIIHEPPTRSDFAQYTCLQGKKKNLLDNILFSMTIKGNKKGVKNIFVPALPLPKTQIKNYETLEDFYTIFLSNLKRVVEPILIVLVGDKTHAQLAPTPDSSDKKTNKKYNYFSIPELEYIMSVSEVKKNVWENWKEKKRTIKNDLFF